MSDDPIKDGQLILPRMAEAGGYHMTCCDCQLVHRLDFTISAQHGLELRVYRDDVRTAIARAPADDDFLDT
jgi:hypothetical protein